MSQPQSGCTRGLTLPSSGRPPASCACLRRPFLPNVGVEAMDRINDQWPGLSLERTNTGMSVVCVASYRAPVFAAQLVR